MGRDTSTEATDRRPAPAGLLARFRRDGRGATAVEFAMIAAPFLALLFAIIETALIMWSTQLLETGVADAARKIYTGQFQQGKAKGITSAELQTAFINELCVGKDAEGKDYNRLPLFDCKNIVKVDARVLTSFGAWSNADNRPKPTKVTNGTSEFDSSGFKFDCPKADQIVLVTAALPYKVFLSPSTSGWANLAGGYRLLMASSAFRTEPFGAVCES